MTPIVKLVFGVDYDKARLTEFAAALSFAQRQEIALGAFQNFIEKQPACAAAINSSGLVPFTSSNRVWYDMGVFEKIPL
jgi:hypothetical protein